MTTNLLTHPLVLGAAGLVLAAVAAFVARRYVPAASRAVRARLAARSEQCPRAAGSATAPSGWLLVVARAGVAVVGATALVLSYGALHSLALAANISPSLAWLWPVAVDVLAVVSAIAARTFHGRLSSVYAWLVLVLFLSLSVWGNGLHATLATVQLTSAQAVVVSATPPVALALALHLLLMMLARTAPNSPAVPPVPEQVDPPDVAATKADMIRAAITITGDAPAAHALLTAQGHDVSRSYVFKLAKAPPAVAASLNGSGPHPS